MRRIALIGSILGVLGVAVISGVPAFGAGNGTVTATVTVQDVPCITIGGTTINYGTKSFSTSAGLSVAAGSINNIASCSGSAQSLLGSGTNASATGVSWQLSDVNFSCSVPDLNKFKHNVDPTTGPPTVSLALTNKSLGSLTANQPAFSLATALVMPCEGSSGAGKQVTTSIILTATIP